MKLAPKIAFVSAGLLKPKKTDHGIAREHRYLNYGLLGLATIASSEGYDCRVVHGFFDKPDTVARRVLFEACEIQRPVVLLSIPSSLAIQWSREFCDEVMQLNSKARIIVGGRWVVGDDPNWLKVRLPLVEDIVAGTAENKIVSILGEVCPIPTVKNPQVLQNLQRFTSYPRLNYSLLEKPTDFQPSIEVSRGCGMGCSFCVERNDKLNPLRSPKQIVDEYLAYLKQTGQLEAKPYFECSFFRPSTEWIRDLGDELCERGVSFEWRTESRVDSFSIEQCSGLQRAGMKVLDLGLESASPKQLVRMQKTRNPDAYLRRASKLLKGLFDIGVWAKVNVLLYLDESLETLNETTDWLDEHRSFIKGVSVNPIVAYRGLDDSTFLNQIEDLKEKQRVEDGLVKDGFVFPNLSGDSRNKNLC
ncbi:MAG: radical SAM protein [Gimesia sp.]|uniref:Radical SAM protein n=1 Tax=Gimesia maris TaxID=122 RepID=A0A3D3R6Q9_9PLAN|nr:radical SAM protein [Gimesia sp.]HCO23310.1 radical SAM protein [Gimesia maris]|tara:strand:+ start:2234 stop:3484 length:1251 start_codon:yes stop_codon:yes gene_type:complete